MCCKLQKNFFHYVKKSFCLVNGVNPALINISHNLSCDIFACIKITSCLFKNFILFLQIFISTKSVYAKYISLRSKAVSFSVSDSPLQHQPPPPHAPSAPPPHPSYVHLPSSHFIPPLHPSHVLRFISLYLSPLVSPLPSLHLAYLSASLLAQ